MLKVIQENISHFQKRLGEEKMEEEANYYEEFTYYYDLIEEHFGMKFEDVIAYVPNTVLQKLGYISGSNNYVVKFFSKKFHKKLYHNREEMVKAIVKQLRSPHTPGRRKIRLLKEVSNHTAGILQYILKTEGKFKIGEDNFYAIKVAAEELGVSISTARSWVRDGKMSATFMGMGYLVAESEINRLKNKG